LQVVCEYRDVVASASAIARAYPLYSRKTGAGSNPQSGPTVTVEFILTDCEPPKAPISCPALNAIAKSVRMAARIVDTPCNEMNVQHFLGVSPIVKICLQPEKVESRLQEVSYKP
jgi:probable aminopeptidase NPEPL1